MTYEEFINSIPRDRILERSESHHIIPRCIGGNDHEDNLIDLTPREHFIAHMLLARENPHENKLTYAFHLMSTDGRHEVTPDEYELARKMHSESMKGKSLHTTPHTEETKKLISKNTKIALANPKTHKRLVEAHQNPSEEVKKKISEARSGTKLTEETRRRMSESHLGKKYAPMSEEGRKNISNAQRGRVVSQETRDKLSSSHRGMTYPPMSQETKDKISKSVKAYLEINGDPRKGLPLSDEHKQKLSIAAKSRKYHHICKRCGREFTSGGNKSIYCKECKELGGDL